MANIKDLIEHIARKHWEHGQGGVWDRPADAPDAPFPAYATEDQKNQFRAYASRLLEDAPILATLMQEDALRKLQAQCREAAAEDYTAGRLRAVYTDVADRLSAILDGDR